MLIFATLVKNLAIFQFIVNFRTNFQANFIRLIRLNSVTRKQNVKNTTYKVKFSSGSIFCYFLPKRTFSVFFNKALTSHKANQFFLLTLNRTTKFPQYVYY